MIRISLDGILDTFGIPLTFRRSNWRHIFRGGGCE